MDDKVPVTDPEMVRFRAYYLKTMSVVTVNKQLTGIRSYLAFVIRTDI